MKRIASVAAPLLLVAAACGGDDDEAAAGGDVRTVEIATDGIAYSPDWTIEVARGETVRFVFENTGAVAHDAFVGDEDTHDEHEDEMREMEGMDHGGDSDAITVEPGDEGELLYTFDD